MAELIDLLMKYESDTGMNDDETLELFAELIRTGQAWTLQGTYGRTASYLIGEGFISENGEVL